MIHLGTVLPGSTVRIPFSSFDKDDGSSITMTNFAAADILVYKDGGTTERASTNGFTATTDFDSKTGKHLIVLDLADNTTADFWAAGSDYQVAVDAVTVDTVTTGGWVGSFRIGYPGAILDTTIATLASQTSFTLTSGPADDDALNGMWAVIHDAASAVQKSWVLIDDYTGASKTVTLAAGATFTVAAKDNISVMFPAPLQPTTTGRKLDVTTGGEAGIDWANVGSPTTTVNLSGTTVKTATDVETDTADIQSRLPAALVGGRMDANVGAISADATAADNAESFFDGTGYAGTNNVIPTVTTVTNAVTAGTVSDKTGYSISGTTTTLDALQTALNAAHGAGSWATATGFSTHSAADVWAVGTREITGGTITTYTGNTPQTGDGYAYLVSNLGTAGAAATEAGGTGDHLTALAPAATALSTVTWTPTRAGYLDNLSGGAVMLAASYTAPPSAATIATQVDSTLSASHGAGSWATATGFSTLDAAGVRSAVGLATANLDSQLAAIVADTNELQTDWANGGRLDLLVDAILDDTGTSGVVVASGSKSGYALSATGADLVLVDGKTLPAALQIIGAVVAGKISGAGTASEVFVGLDGVTTRVTVTADASGNRSAVTYA